MLGHSQNFIYTYLSQAVMLLTCIREVRGSNPDWYNHCLVVLSGFSLVTE